jgi:preprotein translocase subunit SecE
VTETPTAERGRASGAGKKRASLFARIGLFLRQVRAELFKVVWPTRKELITYTIVVMAFVAMIMVYVGVLDFGISKLVLAVFGD